jgi:uncharacterized protein (DUF2249 family)
MTPDLCTLDVRPLLAAGEEPFAAIMAATDGLSPGQALCLITPFRPVPLFTVMANRGFAVSDRTTAPGIWEALFTPIASAAPEPGLAPGSASGAAFWPDPIVDLDLTGLLPPEPMVRVLESLQDLPAGAVLFALLDREPMFLFPELATRGHEWVGNFSADHHSYRLMVRRGAEDHE